MDNNKIEDLNRLKKWRLILGENAEEENESSYPLDPIAASVDRALDALYGESAKAGLGSSAPKVSRWLGDIRKYFNKETVQIMQKDAFERLGIERMLLEPELLQTVEADINLVSTLISLNKVIPTKTRETARLVVKKVLDQLIQKMQHPMREAVMGALSSAFRNRRPKLNEIDWHRTIKLNLKHYQPEYKSIIPQNLIGHGKKGQSLRNVILCVDQSGSMAASVVYSSVFGAVLASIPSLKTKMIVFDTAVADLTKELHDPVDLLFGAQLGGGTDINKALNYAEQQVENPNDTILILISDLYEGGNASEMLKRAGRLKASGVQFICLLALDDEGIPAYDKAIAEKLSAFGIPVFGCSPNVFPDLMAAVIKKDNLKNFLSKHNIALK
jgi:Mg-chelatase subunit ChlD